MGAKIVDFFEVIAILNPFDELITWREVGFQFAHHRLDYVHFDSLPDWAKNNE